MRSNTCGVVRVAIIVTLAPGVVALLAAPGVGSEAAHAQAAIIPVGRGVAAVILVLALARSAIGGVCAPVVGVSVPASVVPVAVLVGVSAPVVGVTASVPASASVGGVLAICVPASACATACTDASAGPVASASACVGGVLASGVATLVVASGGGVTAGASVAVLVPVGALVATGGLTVGGISILAIIVVMVVVVVMVDLGAIGHGLDVRLLAAHARSVSAQTIIQVVHGLGAAGALCVVALTGEGAVTVLVALGAGPATVSAQMLELLAGALHTALALHMHVTIHEQESPA